jgi:hypothetical protein
VSTSSTSADDDSVVKDGQRTGVAILYFIFAGFTVSYLFFLETYVPETKGMIASDFLPKESAFSSKFPLLGEDIDMSMQDA